MAQHSKPSHPDKIFIQMYVWLFSQLSNMIVVPSEIAAVLGLGRRCKYVYRSLRWQGLHWYLILRTESQVFQTGTAKALAFAVHIGIQIAAIYSLVHLCWEVGRLGENVHCNMNTSKYIPYVYTHIQHQLVFLALLTGGSWKTVIGTWRLRKVNVAKAH